MKIELKRHTKKKSQNKDTYNFNVSVACRNTDIAKLYFDDWVAVRRISWSDPVRLLPLFMLFLGSQLNVFKVSLLLYKACCWGIFLKLLLLILIQTREVPAQLSGVFALHSSLRIIHSLAEAWWSRTTQSITLLFSHCIVSHNFLFVWTYSEALYEILLQRLTEAGDQVNILHVTIEVITTSDPNTEKRRFGHVPAVSRIQP